MTYKPAYILLRGFKQGELKSGEVVAVKKLVRAMPNLQKQFENEINLLMKLHHQNIVRSVGYSYETQHLHKQHEGEIVCARNTESSLCLEYLTNGSLDNHISGMKSIFYNFMLLSFSSSLFTIANFTL